MTHLEKSSMKITTVIMVIGMVGSGLVNYYSNKQSVIDAITSVKDEFKDEVKELEKKDVSLDGKDLMHDRDINDLRKNQERFEEAAMSYLSKTPQKIR